MAFFNTFKNNIIKGWARSGTNFGWRDYAILGGPPLICVGIYFWKSDTERMIPAREKKARKAQERAIASAAAAASAASAESPTSGAGAVDPYAATADPYAAASAAATKE